MEDVKSNKLPKVETENVWIIDTDYSYDDQYALEFLVKKGMKIIAITTCGAGSAHPEAIKMKIEEDLKKLGNKDIKVYAGADRSYINYQKELKDDPIFESYNYKKVDFFAYEERAKQKEPNNPQNITERLANVAAVKIGDLVKKHSKNLNILCLGPLTNLSLAVLLDASIKNGFNNLFIAGGSYTNMGNSGNSAEYNFRVDPVAAKNVINYFQNITMIPLEVESQVEVREFVKYKPQSHKDLFELLENVQSEDDSLAGHYSVLGLLAAILVMSLESVKLFEFRPVDVDIIGRLSRGGLVIEKYEYLKSGKFNDIFIIEDVYKEKFVEAFASYFQ